MAAKSSGEFSQAPASVTARGRRELGSDTEVLNPFDIHTDRLGPSATYNPLDTLNPDVKSFGADCDRVADGVVVHNERDSNPHFNDSARSLASGVIRYLAKYERDPNLRNLNTMRAVIAGPTAILQSFCQRAVRTGDLHSSAGAEAPRPFGVALRALTATGKLEAPGYDTRRVTTILWPSPASVIPPTVTQTIGLHRSDVRT